ARKIRPRGDPAPAAEFEAIAFPGRVKTCRLFLLVHFFGATVHFFRRNVFDVRGETPVVTEWIVQHSYAVSIELIGQRARHCGAGRSRAVEEWIDIFC